MKKFLKVVLTVLVIAVLIVCGGFFYLSRGLGDGKRLVINEVKTSTLSNGTYDGKYDSGRWSNELKVTVKDGKITAIEVAKDVTIPNQECTQELFKRVIEKQNTNVDTIAGATVTSKAYLKSIENALTK